jgi:hypothetical protein
VQERTPGDVTGRALHVRIGTQGVNTGWGLKFLLHDDKLNSLSMPRQWSIPQQFAQFGFRSPEGGSMNTSNYRPTAFARLAKLETEVQQGM